MMMRKLVVLGLFLLLPIAAAAQTADEVIGKYLEARGGLAKIRAIRSERVSGTISFGPGEEGPFVVERARPLKMHMEVNLNGQTAIRTYDGKSAGWIYDPFQEHPLRAMTADDLKNIFNEADFDGPFIDYKAKGNQVEFAGKDEVEGKPINKLKLTNKNGDVSYFSFDASSSLLLRWQGTRKVGDKNVDWQSFFRDYRDVSGIRYPFLIDSDAPGTEQKQQIVADKIELNIPIDETHFGKPVMPEAPATPAKPN